MMIEDSNVSEGALYGKTGTGIKGHVWFVGFMEKSNTKPEFYERKNIVNTPYIETERLLLRPFCEEDTQNVFECWESDPDVAKYMFWCSHNNIKKTKEWISFEMEQIPSDKWYRWAVISKGTNELIGTGLVYFEEEYNLFEVSYNFGKKYWGQGYAIETMRAVVNYAENVLRVEELVGRYAKDNPASGNLLKKLGFVYCKDIPYEANEGKNHYEGIECRRSFNKG